MTSAAVRTGRPVITAWSAVSAYGIGRAAYRAGLASGVPGGAAPADPPPTGAPDRSTGAPDRSTGAPDRAPGPPGCTTGPSEHPAAVPDRLVRDRLVHDRLVHDRLVPDFEVRKVLGKAGTRTMDRATGLAATAVRELFDEAEADARPVPTGAGTALVLGTNVGGVAGQHDFVRASFEGDKPYDVPAQNMPSVLMNCAAAASAIRYGLKGPNTTLAGGRPAGLLALGYARRLLAAGRAERVLVGAVEEYSPIRAAYERHARAAGEDAVPLGEGCAVLLVEPGEAARPAGEGRVPLAELLAIEVRGDVTGDLPGTLAACVEQALADSGSSPADVWAAVSGGLGGPLGEAEEALLAQLFGYRAATRVPVHHLIGDTSAASGAFQLTATLAAAADSVVAATAHAQGTAADGTGEGTAAGRTAVLTSVDRDGTAACAVLRLLGRGTR